MKYKNLNIKWEKIAALVLAGTMVFSLSGCSKKESKEEVTTPYIETIDGRIDEYLNVSLEYTKAKEMYELYPTTENLRILKQATINLNETVCNEISEKLDGDFYCFITELENGNKKYVLRELDDETRAFTQEVTPDGEGYGEIKSQIILDAYGLVFEIPNKSIDKWNKKDIEKFMSVANAIDENAKQIYLTDFEIVAGNIVEVVYEDQKNSTK